MNERDSTGYRFLMFPRPDLFNILLNRIPPDRISFGKRVLLTKRQSSGVQIVCSDNTCYEGDIIVGADGAYSAVRHNMFREMREQQEQEVHHFGGSSIVIPPSDTKDFAIPYMCMVGVTRPMDADKYPVLRHPNTQLHHVIGESTPYSVRFL
jgi:2-polyprenyl-6-methoxyphenol hydroxylase-like FAD-dependent oxidoreductase